MLSAEPSGWDSSLKEEKQTSKKTHLYDEVNQGHVTTSDPIPHLYKINPT